MKRLQITYVFSILLILQLVLSACAGTTSETAAEPQEAETNSEQMPSSMEGAEIPADLDLNTDRMTDQGLFHVRITSNLDPVDINELHSWTLHLETPDGQAVDNAEVSIGGGMPQHNHGFPTSPQVTENLGNGDYLVEGVRFNMTGWWEMAFDIAANGQQDQITFNVVVETGQASEAMVDMEHEDHGDHGDDMAEMDHEEHSDHTDAMAEMDHDEAAGLVVDHMVANLTLPTPTGAIYMTIINHTDQDDALLAASIDGCESVEFHQSSVEDDIASMGPVEGGQIALPAGETVTLEPGGLHIMCVGKTGDFSVGDHVPVTLTFANADEITGMIEVKEPGDIDMAMDHEDHTAHDHEQISNDGAVIRIVSPDDGAEIAAGDMLMVKVEAEGFDLAAQGNHWHLYIDGELVEMVVGSRDETMVHGLEAGEHTILTTLSDADHNELEGGDSLSITVKQ